MHDPALFSQDEPALTLGLRSLRHVNAVLSRPLVWRVGAVLLILAAALSCRLALSHVLGDHPTYVLFYPAILAAGLLCSFRAGLWTVAAVALLVHAPFGSFQIAALDTSADVVGLAAFGVFGFIVVVVGSLLRNLSRARSDSEELIRLNAEQLGNFVEQAPAAMAMFDRDMRYLAASGRWREIFHLTRDLAGKPHYHVFPEIPSRWKEIHRQALAGETIRDEEDKFLRLDGTTLWLRWEVRPWRDARGGVGGILIFSEDIGERIRAREAAEDSDRKLAEQALRDNESRLSAVVDTAMEGIVSFDVSGVILSANPAARDMFGYENDEMLGSHVSMLLNESLRLAHDGLIDCLRAGERKPFGARRRLEGRRKDGVVFPLEIALSEATLNGQRLFVGCMRDLGPIEEEKRRVDALLAELCHAVRLNDMGEMVASLAHEIAQPIAAIQNFAAAYRRTVSGTGEPPRTDLIALIEAQGRRAAEILKRLRGFIAKRPPERRAENIEDLIDDAIQLALLRSRAHVEYRPPAAKDADLSVFVDPVLIGQVLVNLLRNADDALIDTLAPQIRVEAARAERGMVRISVSDNGAGVDPEAVDDLFKPFHSSKAAGLGVGLSIGRAIVETYGGVLTYRPNAPRGSIFEFTLPIYAGDDAVSAPLL